MNWSLFSIMTMGGRIILTHIACCWCWWWMLVVRCRSSGDSGDGGRLSPSVGGGHSWLVAVRGWWAVVARCCLWVVVLVVGENGQGDKKKGRHVLFQEPVRHHQRSNRHLELTPRLCGCGPIPFLRPIYVIQR